MGMGFTVPLTPEESTPKQPAPLGFVVKGLSQEVLEKAAATPVDYEFPWRNDK